jgi:flagellar hook-basal body complex protein FliE
MTMPIVGPVAAPTISPISTASAAPSATPTSGAGFANELARGLDWLQRTQSTADNLAVKAATGDLTDVHDYMVASTQASLATELTVAVRNKAVDAFNEIMRMQA